MTIDVASAAVLRLLAERAPGATICPSEVARKIAGEATGYDEADWRNVMPVVHAAIDHQVEQGNIRLGSGPIKWLLIEVSSDSRWQEDAAMTDLELLSETQMRRIEPYFPRSHGVPRVDDRRVVSGILFVIRNGLRWRDAPGAYGPHKTLYNRFVRWSQMVSSTASSLHWPAPGMGR